MTEATRVSADQLSRAKDVLYTPVVCDILDEMGRFHQFLPPGIRSLRPDDRMLGRAMPVLVGDVYGPNERPFGKMTQALDQLESGEVYVATGKALSAAWGEIMTATARMRGAVGAVVDGHHRDTHAVLEQDFPVFSRGSYAFDSRPRSGVLDYRLPIEIGKVRVAPGDLVFGDIDGVVVIPGDIEVEVIERAIAKASAENTVRREVEAGRTATEVLADHGIL